MILNSLHLKPFAGTKNRKLEFKPGLNVVLGNNEAGKSTLLHALSNVLFHKVRLTPTAQKEFSKRYFPADGTDHASVEVAMQIQDKELQLLKFWSAGQNRQIKFSEKGGADLTTDETIEKKLQELLGFNRATYDQVLFTDQRSVEATLQSLRADKELLPTFSDLLRSAVVEQAGVSSAVLQQKIEALVKSYYERWDELSDSPEGNKGIENPWKTGLGIILKAYYHFKHKENELKLAREYDETLDKLVVKIGEKRAALKQAKAIADKLGPYEQDIVRRSSVVHELEKAKAREHKIREATKAWPGLESDVPRLEAEVKQLVQALEALVAEEKVSFRLMEVQKEKESFSKAKQIKPELDKLLKESEKYSESIIKDYPTLQRYEDRMAALRQGIINLTSSSMYMLLKSDKTTEVKIKDDKGEQAVSLSSTQEKEISLSAGQQIEVDGLHMTIGNKETAKELESNRESLAKGEKMIADLLATHGCANASELEEKFKTYTFLKESIQRQQIQLNALLGKKSFEQWEKEMSDPALSQPARSLQEISSDKNTKQQKKLETEHQLKLKRTELEQYRNEFGQQDKLFDLILEVGGQVKELDKRLSQMKSLPEGYATDQEFMNALAIARRDIESIQSALITLENERALNEGRAPEQDAHMLQQEVQLAESALRRTKEEGKAYKKIKQTLDGLLAETNNQSFKPFHDNMQKYFGLLTQGRYQQLSLDKDLLPSEILTTQGNLEIDHLSKGTHDALAMSVRLGMAEHYLDGRKGLLVLDDPFTDLDPGRQKAAALCLQELATEKQVLFFTCHPAMAEMLGGNLIRI